MRNGRFRQHGRVTTRNRRLQATVLAMLIIVFIAPGVALAAPTPASNSTVTRESNLGGGTYAVTASVFAEGTDGQVGTTASSGHVIQPNDNLVALPACTESSCPWVPLGTGTDGTYGPQTTCAEADGLCWVEVVSDSTGICTVAPVHDRGPLFVRDNYWAPQNQREYNLPQGVPAAEAARDGADLGFGPGISDVGHDIQNVYTYAAAIDLAEGTWNAIGLPTSAGIADVTVTMLWQAGLTSDQACDGNGGGGDGGGDNLPGDGHTGDATVISSLNLRSGPGTSFSIIRTMPAGAAVELTGDEDNGFLGVRHNGTPGWAYAAFLDISDGDSGGDPTGNGEFATVTSSLNLRSGAGTSFGVIVVMPAGAKVELTGDSGNGFLEVIYNGKAGWAFAAYLDTSDGGGGGDEDPTGNGEFATVTSSLNLRSGAGTTFGVIVVMPAGAEVELTGDSGNGFLEVIYNGKAGWAFAAYLDTSDGGGGGNSDPVGNGEFATVTSSLNLRSGAGTSFGVIVVMPAGAEVELTGESGNGFLEVIYNGAAGWASATYLNTGGGGGGDTATVINGSLNLRSGPATSYSVLLVMPGGATVQLTGEAENGFLGVNYNGTEGWASAQYLD